MWSLYKKNVLQDILQYILLSIQFEWRFANVEKITISKKKLSNNYIILFY